LTQFAVFLAFLALTASPSILSTLKGILDDNLTVDSSVSGGSTETKFASNPRPKAGLGTAFGYGPGFRRMTRLKVASDLPPSSPG
jgi:hypothetical protein